MLMKIWGFLMASLMGLFFATAAFPAATFIPEVDPPDPEELPSFLVVSRAGNIDARIVNYDPYNHQWVIEFWDHTGTRVFAQDDIQIYSVDGARVFVKGNKPYAELHEIRLNKPDRTKIVEITSCIPGVVRIDDGTIMSLMDKNGFPY